MTIQIPNPGTGNGQTGDNEFVLWSKVKDNFTDTNNAASRLVGTAAGQVPLVENTHDAAFGVMTTEVVNKATVDSTLKSGLFIASKADLGITSGINNYYVVRTFVGAPNAERSFQVAIGVDSPDVYIRNRLYGNPAYGSFRPYSTNAYTYNTTTAIGANVVVTADGTLQRSTSSERYKDILSPLVLDDAKYAQAMALKPIVYRSTAEADNPAHHYYSFSAEELGAYDPAFTLWRTTEMAEDAEGNITEQPLAEKQAEGLNINALLAMSHAIAIKQDKLIKALEARVAALEPKPEV